jgi:hypothetical protein
MERRECFGTVEEVTGREGFTTRQTRPECRSCGEMMECLRHGKKATEERDERDELMKQELIAQIIDLSQIHTNEVGSCVLEFLNRIYQSPLGSILFRNLLLFFELPRNSSSQSLTVPVSPATLGLIQGRREEREASSDPSGRAREQRPREGFTLRIILIQRHVAGNRKANMGLIAREVMRMFSSDRDGTDQICQTLTASEGKAFRGMSADSRVTWLMKKWGFQEELKAAEEGITE